MSRQSDPGFFRWLAVACGLAAPFFQAACASLPVDVPREESHVLTQTADTNTEIGLVFETPDLAAQGASQLLAAVSGNTYRLVLVPGASGTTARKIEWVEQDNGREVRHDIEPQASVWRRMGVWFMSLLPIESQL